MAKVEVVDKHEKHHGRSTDDGVAHAASAQSASSAAAAATEKEVARTRLGALHRLLNNRKGYLSATYKKNAEANDRANDMNQKTIQALDTQAEDYGTFEETMNKVMSEHGEGDVSCSGLRGG